MWFIFTLWLRFLLFWHLKHGYLSRFFSHLRGHMGLKAAADAVTVATFDTLAFCGMNFSNLTYSWRTSVIQSSRCCLDQTTTFMFCWTASQQHRSVASKSQKKSSFSTIHFASSIFQLWRFLQAADHRTVPVNNTHYQSISSHLRCGAMHPSGLQVMVAGIYPAVMCLSIWASLHLPSAVNMVNLPDRSQQ